jgi:uncharacterized protein
MPSMLKLATGAPGPDPTGRPGNPTTASGMPLAAGVGLRFPHHHRFAQDRPQIAWLEAHAENYVGGGTVRRHLDRIRRDYPLSLHGVGLSLGSSQGLDLRHLERIAALVDEVQPQLVSEHLSWSIVDDRYLADLLPLPMTDEALEVVCRHVTQVQERLRRSILIENPSTYVEFGHSSIPEWEFLDELAHRTGCGLLCDVNNIFVSASNHGWNAEDYLRGLSAAAIEEIHLAGHATRTLRDGRVLRIDNHGSRVAPQVWDLYCEALRLYGPKPTLIEWDTDIPTLEVLMDEAAHAQRLLHEAMTVDVSRTDGRGACTLHAPGPQPHRETRPRRPVQGQGPVLLDVQQELRARLFGDSDPADHPIALVTAPSLGGEALERLSIYRNTCRSVLVNALRLSFPAVQDLVGEEFFEGAAQRFIDEAPNGVPGSAWLNEYGAEFPAFLASFPPAAGIAYLPDVAQLEWAVNRALHAPEAMPLDPTRLADAESASTRADVRLVPHGSITLLSLGSPADAIWRAVLDRDDAALAAIDPTEGPVWLLVERGTDGIGVRRLTQSAWRFTARLCAGYPLHTVIDEEPAESELRESAAALLAEHLLAGRFIAALGVT